MYTPTKVTEREFDSYAGIEAADVSGSEVKQLQVENAELRARLEETEATLTAIRSGDVDGLVVGDDIYILNSANIAANRLRNDVLVQMEDAVLAFDTDDRIIFMNAAAERQYGRESSEVLGRCRHELYEEQWPDADGQRVSQAAMQTMGAYRAHSVHIRKDGVAMHVESAVSHLRDVNGADMGCLVVIRDITERVRVEETLQALTLELRDADRRKDEFLATLAHELRNPLAPIRNALQIMQLTTDVASQRNAREIIQRQLGHMVHLVDDLLDVSRISQGKVELRLERVDVALALQTAIETSRPAIDRGKHELVLQLPEPGALIVHADLTRLCQIIANVLNNAAKYTPERGRIEVTAQLDGEYVSIAVRDSGIGIPPEMLPRIFEMFAQVNRSLERSQGGLGIGLALVKRLMEMHGGSVQVASDGPGCGSEFRLRLPAMPAVAVESPYGTTYASNVKAAHACRVLVVDDNVDSANSLSCLLDMMGYQTCTANDGLTAVQTAESFAPRAVFLDLGLPRLNGLEAARRIRKQKAGKDMLLVALSGWGQDEDRRRSKDAGFDYHFVKPVTTEVLTQLLDRLGQPSN